MVGESEIGLGREKTVASGGQPLAASRHARAEFGRRDCEAARRVEQ